MNDKCEICEGTGKANNSEFTCAFCSGSGTNWLFKEYPQMSMKRFKKMPKVTGKDAERFLEMVERNSKSMEERRKHLKKAIESTKRINENS